jgi:O-antigen ligase
MSMARTGSVARFWVTAGVLCLSLVLGLIAGISPMLGLMAAIGLLFAAATIANVTLGLVLFTFVSFLATLSSGSGANLTKLAGLLLFGSWYLSRLVRGGRREVTLPKVHPIFWITCVAFVAWSAISAVWAYDSSTALSNTERFALLVVLIPVVLAAVRTRQQLLWVLAAYVVAATVSALYGFAVPNAAVPGRLTGTIGDPNEQAAVLVAAIPMALALARSLRGRQNLQAFCWLAIAICVAGIVATLSRGGLVSFGVMMLAGVIWGGRWRRVAVILLLVVGVGTVGYFAFAASSSAAHRVSSSNSDGRSDIWTIGLRMFRAHPVLGVGSGNFMVAERFFLQQPGLITDANLVIGAVPQPAQNVYLSFLAELGIPGLLIFVTILLSAFTCAWRAALIFKRRDMPDMELLARCLLLALVAMMTANVFLTDDYSKQLWLIIGLCPAVLALARSERFAAAEPARPAPPAPRALPEPVPLPLRSRPAPVPTL